MENKLRGGNNLEGEIKLISAEELVVKRKDLEMIRFSSTLRHSTVAPVDFTAGHRTFEAVLVPLRVCRGICSVI